MSVVHECGLRYETEKRYLVGIDVGSMTVKAVACLEGGDDLSFRLYARHESCQADTVLSALQKPHFCFRDLDENKASASRIETRACY
jgi:activator of 2-hydroxyglutaryl-CoA dehydratase